MADKFIVDAPVVEPVVAPKNYVYPGDVRSEASED